MGWSLTGAARVDYMARCSRRVTTVQLSWQHRGGISGSKRLPAVKAVLTG